MRAIPDRRLAEPYRSWSDRRKPLPGEVLVLPRALTPWTTFLRFVSCWLFFWFLGSVALLPFTVCGQKSDGAGLTLITMSLLFFLTPLVELWKFLITLSAVLDEKMGRLRQGILIGPEGILVRLKPNECHAVDMADFKGARACVSKCDSQNELYRIETAAGPLEFSTHRMETPPHVLSKIIARLGWKTEGSQEYRSIGQQDARRI